MAVEGAQIAVQISSRRCDQPEFCLTYGYDDMNDDGDLQIQEKTNTEYGIGDGDVGDNGDVDDGVGANGYDNNGTS